MSSPDSLLELIAELAKPEQRPETARALAQRLGGDSLLVFIPDPESTELRPAPGFPNPLPGHRAWPAFLARCQALGRHTAQLPSPVSKHSCPALGLAAPDGSVLVLLGGPPHPQSIAQVATLLPLLAAALHYERPEPSTADPPPEVEELATELDAARQELQTARRQAERLADFGAHLASPDYETALPAIARLLIPWLADWCVIHIIDDRKSYLDSARTPAGVAHLDPDQVPVILHLWQQHPLPAKAAHGLPQVLRTGRAELVPEVTGAWLEELAQDPAQLEHLRTLDVRSYTIAPLSAHGRTLGALTCARTRASRGYSPDEFILIEDVARRIALALDNARLARQAEEAVQLRDAFLSMASHELRTPVTSIKGYAQLLLRYLPPGAGDRAQRALHTIDRQATQLSALINGLLDISRIESGQLELRPERLELSAFIREVIRELEVFTERHPITLHAAEPVWVQADRARLKQVLTNLVQNAIKFSPDGGPIDLRLTQAAGQALVAVTDPGIGVPAGELEHIFGRFARASNASTEHYGGLGLGLYISREIITRHGGRLWAESQLGHGSTFSFTLPVS